MKLITWNVQWFCGLDDQVSVQRIVREAQAMADFDVICMQEVAVNYPAVPGNACDDQPALLQALLPDHQVFFGAAVDEFRTIDGRVQRQRFGNLIASRLPVLQVQHYPLPYPADTTPGGVRSMPRMCTMVTVQALFGPVRLMTTHLEFYSPVQRMAQVEALRALHAQACVQVAHPPAHDETGWPFQNKTHTTSAILCGDFNFEPSSDEYRHMLAPLSERKVAGVPVNRTLDATNSVATGFTDAWGLVHGNRPHDPTFRLFDRRYGPVPISCDFCFVSSDLAGRVQRIEVNRETQASDHQPVLVEFAPQGAAGATR